MELDALIAMSHRYGADAEFVLAGGGNTSYKTEDTLYIKGSGHEAWPPSRRKAL